MLGSIAMPMDICEINSDHRYYAAQTAIKVQIRDISSECVWQLGCQIKIQSCGACCDCNAN